MRAYFRSVSKALGAATGGALSALALAAPEGITEPEAWGILAVAASAASVAWAFPRNTPVPPPRH